MHNAREDHENPKIGYMGVSTEQQGSVLTHMHTAHGGATHMAKQATAKATAPAPVLGGVPATLSLIAIEDNARVIRIDAGTTAGKLSSTGKSNVLVSDKVKFTRADGQEVVVQVTAYIPVGK